MADDLVKRLRAVGGVRHDGATRWYVNPDGSEAADRIEQLEAALREFSCKCNSNCEWERDEICPSWIARAALGEKTDD